MNSGFSHLAVFNFFRWLFSFPNTGFFFFFFAWFLKLSNNMQQGNLKSVWNTCTVTAQGIWKVMETNFFFLSTWAALTFWFRLRVMCVCVCVCVFFFFVAVFIFSHKSFCRIGFKIKIIFFTRVCIFFFFLVLKFC